MRYKQIPLEPDVIEILKARKELIAKNFPDKKVTYSNAIRELYTEVMKANKKE